MKTIKTNNNRTHCIKIQCTSTLHLNAWMTNVKNFILLKGLTLTIRMRKETLTVYWAKENLSRTQFTSFHYNLLILIRPFVLVENRNLYREQNKWLRIGQSKKTRNADKESDKFSSGCLPMWNTSWRKVLKCADTMSRCFYSIYLCWLMVFH